MPCFPLRAILIRSKFPFVICCMHILRIVPVDKILHYINNNNIFWACTTISHILCLELFIIYWLGVRNFEDSKTNWYKERFQF